MNKELVMYSRTLGCPFVSIAKQTLAEYNVSYREIFIDKDDAARQYVIDTTGFLSVPTLVVSNIGEDLPYEPPAPLAQGTSPRGVHRGTVITEANRHELIAWLQDNGFIQEA